MKLNRSGYKFVVEDSDNTSWWNYWSLFENGSWEFTTFPLVDSLLPAGGLFVDVGAWIGPYTLWVAKTKIARVIAFEPDPEAFGQLTRNVRMNDLEEQVELNHAACATFDGHLKLYPVAGFGESTSSMTYEVGEPVTVRAIDLVERLRALPAPPDLIKIDIEGGEVDLVPGLLPYLDEHGVPLLISLHPGRCDAEKLAALSDRLLQHGEIIAGDIDNILYYLR